MNPLRFYFILLALAIISCEQEISNEISLDPNFEIQTTSTITSSLDCYQEMQSRIGEGYQGTACSICSSYAANPGDTVTIYGVAYFYDAAITTHDDTDYQITWTVLNGAANLLYGDDPRTVQLIVPASFDELAIQLYNETENNLVVSEILTIRNAQQNIEIGDAGQAGQVMYDKGQYSDDWRYLEVTGVIGSAVAEQRYQMEWGCVNLETLATGMELGDGRKNSATILTFMNDRLPQYEQDPGLRCSHTNDGSAGVISVDAFQNNGFGDWYLPSVTEAQVVAQSLGWLSEDPNEANEFFIWTSTEVDMGHAYAVDLYSGEAVVKAKNANLHAMGIRYF